MKILAVVWQRSLPWSHCVDNFEVQPKDTSKGHFYVSLVKSIIRVAAGTSLVMGLFAVCGWLLILAELLGIVEELV